MGTMIKIQTITVGSGGAASIDFTSIPATYTDLMLVWSMRGGGANPQVATGVRVNNDTGGNYTNRLLQGNGSAASSSTTSAVVDFGYGGFAPGGGATASVFGSCSLYIPNYLSSNQKSASLDQVSENNTTTAYMEMIASIWTGTAAINRLTIYDRDTNSIQQYSSATLYGIKSS